MGCDVPVIAAQKAINLLIEKKLDALIGPFCSASK